MSSIYDNFKKWLHEPLTIDSTKNLFNDIMSNKKENSKTSISAPPVTITSNSNSYGGSGWITTTQTSITTSGSIKGIKGSSGTYIYPTQWLTGSVAISGYTIDFDLPYYIYKKENDEYIQIKDIEEIEIGEYYYIGDISISALYGNPNHKRFYVADFDMYKKDKLTIKGFYDNNESIEIDFIYKNKSFMKV